MTTLLVAAALSPDLKMQYSPIGLQKQKNELYRSFKLLQQSVNVLVALVKPGYYINVSNLWFYNLLFQFELNELLFLKLPPLVFIFFKGSYLYSTWELEF